MVTFTGPEPPIAQRGAARDPSGRVGRPLSETAGELGCRWHKVMRAVRRWGRDLRDEAFSPKLNRRGRTPGDWRTQIVNWHRSKVTNGPTEGAKSPVKLTQRTTFGITNFDHYRIRVLLYADKPNWTLCDRLTPR